MRTRRETIRKMIGQMPISRQGDLVRLLDKAGHQATQSSVSRDLRDLGVAKQGDHYVMLDKSTPVQSDFDAIASFVREVQSAGPNLIVIRTTAGAAQSVAIVLDRVEWSEVVGTISGDDTVFVATSGAAAQRRLTALLHEKFRV